MLLHMIVISFFVHNHCIHDARTHGFPGSVGLTQACPNDGLCYCCLHTNIVVISSSVLVSDTDQPKIRSTRWMFACTVAWIAPEMI